MKGTLKKYALLLTFCLTIIITQLISMVSTFPQLPRENVPFPSSGTQINQKGLNAGAPIFSKGPNNQNSGLRNNQVMQGNTTNVESCTNKHAESASEIKVLGGGKDGTVSLLSLDRKMFAKKTCNDVKACEREENILTGIKGLGVTTDIFCKEKNYFLMDFVDGITLCNLNAKYLAHQEYKASGESELSQQQLQHLKDKYLLGIIKRMVEIYQTLYLHKTMHYDGHCENWMYEMKSGRLLIIDFGRGWNDNVKRNRFLSQYTIQDEFKNFGIHVRQWLNSGGFGAISEELLKSLGLDNNGNSSFESVLEKLKAIH